MITLLDYEPAPVIFEVRGLPRNQQLRQSNWTSADMDDFRGVKTGFVVQCEHGYVKDGTAYDNKGKPVREFTFQRQDCKENFIEVVRNRKTQDLLTDALDGHLSCGLVHMANISYQVGKNEPNGKIREVIQDEPQLQESFERLTEHLSANRLDIGKKSLVLGSVLTMDPKKEKFTGAMSREANKYISREYRKPFVVPEKV